MRVVVLTGAGISAESGVPTFRDADGLWGATGSRTSPRRRHSGADPEMCTRFYDERRDGAGPSSPMPRTARWPGSRALGDDLLVVTQNIDDLHERAGSKRVLHMHGELRSASCRAAATASRWTGA